MNHHPPLEAAVTARWVRAILVVFLTMGLGFGTWLSRLPSLRDDLGASTIQMSVYGLCLAAGSLAGLVFAGPLIERFGPRRVMAPLIAVQVVALPGAAALMVSDMIALGLVSLFAYGFCFSSTDIAMNVSGANAERAYGRSRLPLMHAGYSIGSVLSMVLGATAEALRIPLVPHFIAVGVLIGVCALVALRLVPKDEAALRASGEPSTLETTAAVPVVESPAGDELATITGSVPVISQPRVEDRRRPGAPGRTRAYSPWRDRRILLIGVITLSVGLIEGAPADWLPLALVDGRGVSNEFGAVMLGVFFVAIVLSRLLGSVLIGRFGRVPVLRASIAVGAVGVLVVSLVPGPVAMIVGTAAWGLGSGLCWPIAISAAADKPETAVRDVAAVSAIGYTCMLLGPMAFGVIGEHIGLLQSFLLLPVFSAVALLLAGVARPPRER